MKKKSLLSTLLLLLCIGTYTVLNTSFSSGFGSYQPSCGAGGGCHPAQNAATTVTMNGLPTFYNVNTAYPISVTVANGAQSAAGFQIQTNIGTLTKTDPQINIYAGSLSAGHNQRKTMVAGVATFNLTWTSPSTGGTAATFNAVGNAVNTNFSPAGDQWNVAAPTNVALPVSFTNVRAKQLESHILISFETSQEDNVKHFKIERGIDGINFSSIATINPIGNSSYTYQDYDATKAILYYYRIKEVSTSEDKTYSRIVSAKSITENSISIFPTILENNTLTITGVDTKENLDFVLFDFYGRRIWSANLTSTAVSIPELTTGYYFATLFDQSNLIKVQKVFIK